MKNVHVKLPRGHFSKWRIVAHLMRVGDTIEVGQFKDAKKLVMCLNGMKRKATVRKQEKGWRIWRME